MSSSEVQESARRYHLTVCKVCGLEAPFECEHMRATMAGGENVYQSLEVVPLADAEKLATALEAFYEPAHPHSVERFIAARRVLDEFRAAHPREETE